MKTRTRTRRLVAAVAALGLLLAACGDQDEPAATPDAPEDEAPETDDPAEAEDEGDESDADPDAEPAVELDDVPSVQLGTIGIPSIFAMVLPAVAEEAGFYDKYNVDVNQRPMETGVDAARAVQGGDLDIAWSPTGPVMTFAGTGVEVAAVLGMDNIDWLVGSTNPDIRECEDLAGETIGVDSVGGARYSVLEIILDGCDLTIEDVEVAGFGATAIQAVVADQIQTSVIHIDDIYVIEEQGENEMHVVHWLIDSDPDQHYLVFWALRSSLEGEMRESYVRVVAALIETIRWINDPANADEVVRIGAGATGHSEDVVQQSLADFLELEFWPVDRHGLGEDKLDATISEQVRLENIEEGSAPTADGVVDTSVFDDAYDLVQQVSGG